MRMCVCVHIYELFFERWDRVNLILILHLRMHARMQVRMCVVCRHRFVCAHACVYMRACMCVYLLD